MRSDQAVGTQSPPRLAPAPRRGCRGLALLVPFAALAATGFLSGCEPEDCTAMDWYEGLTVDVVSPEILADGTYKIFIEADGSEFDLAIAYEGGFATCRPEGLAGACSDGDALSFERHLFAAVEPSVQTSFLVNLYYSDNRSLAGGPEVARIRIVRDDETVADRRFEPDYVREEINGEGCGVATRAQGEIRLPAGATRADRD